MAAYLRHYYKYLGVRATVMGDFTAEKQYVLAEMQQRLTALKDDRALSRREKEQIIVIAVCSVFRYSAGLVDWTKTELDSISKKNEPTSRLGGSPREWMALPLF